MVVGELKPLILYPNPQPPPGQLAPNPWPITTITLAGASVMLKIQDPYTGFAYAVSCGVVNTDPNPINHYATYTTQTSDFPAAGVYLLELIISYGAGVPLIKPKGAIRVTPSI